MSRASASQVNPTSHVPTTFFELAKIAASGRLGQVRIQRAVEGFSIIAISYYLLSLLKMAIETTEHLGVHERRW